MLFGGFTLIECRPEINLFIDMYLNAYFPPSKIKIRGKWVYVVKKYKYKVKRNFIT